MSTNPSMDGSYLILKEIDKLAVAIANLSLKLTRIEQNTKLLCQETNHLSIPEAAKRYSMSGDRLRKLCKADVIQGCYYSLNPESKKVHYMIMCDKLDELLAKGGVLSLIMEKYMKKR